MTRPNELAEARPWPRLASASAQLRAWLASQSDRSVAQRIAGAAFLIRAVSAGAVYASQVLLARWMGPHEFGIYVYVGAWLLLVGDLVPLGLSTLAQRFIPEYRTSGARDALRGFLTASRWIVFATGTLLAIGCAGLIVLFRRHLDDPYVVPLLLACVSLPFHGLAGMLDGIAGGNVTFDACVASNRTVESADALLPDNGCGVNSDVQPVSARSVA